MPGARRRVRPLENARRNLRRMKRLHIRIEKELDDLLTLEAFRERTSKAAVIRRIVRERLRLTPTPPIGRV